MENKLSVIIPSRSPQYLNQTINDLLTKAEGDVEIIVVLDGIWNEIVEDKRVTYIHHGTIHNNLGMREGINRGVSISKGKWIMKCDEHTLWGQGYDKILEKDCDEQTVVIPRRKRLDADKWEILVDGRADIDYMYVEYPYAKPFDKTQGLHGAEWRQRFYDKKDEMISDTPTMQGSAYFMQRKHWDTTIKELSTEKYGPFTQEAQEISMATWLSGGRVIVNKNTFYAHMHKGRSGKGYNFSTEQYKQHAEWNEKGRLYCINYWLNTKDYKYDFDWLVNKFPDMPGWSKDWKERVEKDKLKDYSTLRYKDDFWLSGLRK